MPDERVIERYFERAMEAIFALTHQVARVAWALEARRVDPLGADPKPCPTCASRLVPATWINCPACGASRKKEDV